MKSVIAIVAGLIGAIVLQGDVQIKIDPRLQGDVDKRYLALVRRVLPRFVAASELPGTKVRVGESSHPGGVIAAMAQLPPLADSTYRLDRYVIMYPKGWSLIDPPPADLSGLEWTIRRSLVVRRVFRLRAMTVQIPVDAGMSYSETETILRAIERGAVSFEKYATARPREFKLWEETHLGGEGILPRLDQVTSVRVGTRPRRTSDRIIEVDTMFSEYRGRLYECTFESGTLLVTRIFGSVH